MKYDLANYRLRKYKAHRSKKLYEYDERIQIFDPFTKESEGEVWLSAAHKYGLIHWTADVFVILPNGNILLQERQALAHDGSAVLSPSAGGHVEVGSSLRSAATRELYEEISLSIVDTDRLIPISDSCTGWQLSYFEAVYTDKFDNIVVVRTDQSGKYMFLTEFPFATEVRNVFQREIQSLWDPPLFINGFHLKKYMFNQEYNAFFALFIDETEICKIDANTTEVKSVCQVSLTELSGIIRTGGFAEDTAQCLLKYDAISHLGKVINPSKFLYAST